MTAQVSACNNSVTLSITLTKTVVLVKAAALAKRVLLWPGRVITARHHAAILHRLDERELRDIGLTRQVVLSTTALDMDQDPSKHLSRIVEERRIHGIRL
jgi:hypothetical protein